jgi:uncharacterized protein YyaL (SSP411 family)
VLPERKAREAQEHLELSCRQMARGGLYDHLGGGFHRYSVDAYWHIPHFEKMLYDEGQLLRTYVETWRRGGRRDDDLLWPVRETVDFMRRELRAEDGGFFASLDADSEGEEGIFYVWTPKQIEKVLGPEAAGPFCAAYGVNERGNFEKSTTHLHDVAGGPREDFAAERAKLLEARAARVRPGTDRKRVLSWNALAISGLARAGSLIPDDSMLAEATAAADFLLEKLVDDRGRLLRVYDGGRAHVLAFLDDHATFLEACLDLHRAGAGDRFLEAAKRVAEAIATRFFDPEHGDLFLTPGDGEPLVHRPRSDHDGAMPHSPGLAVLGLLRAATLAGRDDWRDAALSVLRTHALVLDRAPEAYPTLSRAACVAERGASVAVVVGKAGDPDTEALAARARAVLGPEEPVVVAEPGAPPPGVAASWLEGRDLVDGRAAAYVCRGVTCSLPATEPDAIEPLTANGES